MTDIISGVLKLAFGFLANKARSKISERLNDGDVTHEECRRLIVRELHDIKTKLDGLARKDLQSSLLFLQDGVNGMYQAIIQFQSSENNTSESTEVEPANSLVQAKSPRDTDSNFSPMKDAIALINAIKSLKIHSNTRFISACEKFKLAHEDATRAFANEALSIEDRIQASQVRMMARILGDLEDPDASVSDCLQYLKQLHDIGAIQGTFSVLIKGGIASWRNKAKRLQITSSVFLTNQLLFDFARTFMNSPPAIFDWPAIMFGKEVYHPVLGETRHVRQLMESGVRIMSLDPDITFGEKILPCLSLVNRKREIIAVCQSNPGTIRTFKSSGESRTVCEVPYLQDKDALGLRIMAMDIDAKDSLYLIVGFTKKSNEKWSYKLFVYDKNGTKIVEDPLPFVPKKSFFSPENSAFLYMSINPSGKVAIYDSESSIVYIYLAEFSGSQKLESTSTVYVSIKAESSSLFLVQMVQLL
ncbi:uncharacterized protein LOC114529035 [Dendronephthya gigantea]|uniref:uncharacterized protein LOC114529035 n=1 Tax=Dendronephthya gigantea TaxID=151771 RepID=UPI00106CB39B|nr:uncharacterized protein LOC114529035 [Dendronephthya gigantea]